MFLLSRLHGSGAACSAIISLFRVLQSRSWLSCIFMQTFSWRKPARSSSRFSRTHFLVTAGSLGQAFAGCQLEPFWVLSAQPCGLFHGHWRASSSSVLRESLMEHSHVADSYFSLPCSIGQGHATGPTCTPKQGRAHKGVCSSPTTCKVLALILLVWRLLSQRGIDCLKACCLHYLTYCDFLFLFSSLIVWLMTEFLMAALRFLEQALRCSL